MSSLVGSRRWTERVRPAILERDGHLCRLRFDCCVTVATEVDHIIARAQWPADVPGVDDPPNLQAACGPCNRRKGATTAPPPSLRAWSW